MLVEVFGLGFAPDVKKAELTHVLDDATAFIPEKHQVIVNVDQANESAVEGLGLGLAKKVLSALRVWRKTEVHFFCLEPHFGLIYLDWVDYGILWLLSADCTCRTAPHFMLLNLKQKIS